MDFQQFSRQEDPFIWHHLCELYLCNSRTPNQDKVNMVVFNMIGEAQLCYYQILQDKPSISWGVFKEPCKLHFGPPQSINPLGELVNWKQWGRHINEYISDFQLQLAHANTIWVDGLDELLHIDVEHTRPKSLAESINTGRLLLQNTVNDNRFFYSRQPSRLLPPPSNRMHHRTNIKY